MTVGLLDKLKAGGRRQAADALRKAEKPRAIEIHSVTPVPRDKPEFVRVAFIFTDPPGPYSLQFYEAATGQDAVVAKLPSHAKARYFESRDEARTRVIETEDGEGLWPK